MIPFPMVTEGIYVLSVHAAVGLTATDTVIVTEDLHFPTADAGPDQTIDCATISSDFYLDGSGSSQGPNFLYRCGLPPGGLIVSRGRMA